MVSFTSSPGVKMSPFIVLSLNISPDMITVFRMQPERTVWPRLRNAGPCEPCRFTGSPRGFMGLVPNGLGEGGGSVSLKFLQAVTLSQRRCLLKLSLACFNLVMAGMCHCMRRGHCSSWAAMTVSRCLVKAAEIRAAFPRRRPPIHERRS